MVVPSPKGRQTDGKLSKKHVNFVHLILWGFEFPVFSYLKLLVNHPLYLAKPYKISWISPLGCLKCRAKRERNRCIFIFTSVPLQSKRWEKTRRRLMVSFSISLFRCSLRILDSFGTDAEFNYAEYQSDGTDFGGLDVHLRQMLNMFRKILFKKS